MKAKLHRLRDRGWPIPKYQFAFKRPIAGDVTLTEVRDELLNRHTRIAKWHPDDPANAVPPLLDAQLIELSDGRMVLSGIERHEDGLVARIEDFAQTWVCWLGDD